MKVVYPNNGTVEAKPLESPPIKADVTESPPTSPPQQHQDKKRVSEVSGAAVYQKSEVSVALKGCSAILVLLFHKFRRRKKGR